MPQPTGRSSYDRLGPADLAHLRAERPGAPQHIGLVGVLEGGPLLDSDGGLRLDPIRQWLAAALLRTPRLHQVVRRTWPGQGRPVWVEAPEIALDQHLRVMPVNQPGDQAAFVRACLAALAPPMDRSRPLWDLTLLPGLAEGHIGLVFRLHHAVADGISAVRLFGALCNDATSPPESATTPPEPANTTTITGIDLAADAWRARLAAPRATLRRPDLARFVTRARALRSQLTTAARPAPRTSLNRPIGHTRRLAVVHRPLPALHQSAHQHGATINDAVLAAVAGALQQVLAARGETCQRPLRASVPVSLRTGSGDNLPGNRVGVLTIPLPVDEPDPLVALARVAAASRAEKVRARQAGTLAATISTMAIRAAPWLLHHQRLVNVFVTNVPGPAAPVQVAGARLLDAYPATMLAGNVTLSVAVLSYAGSLNLGITADADAWPDLAVFVDGLHHALDALVGKERCQSQPGFAPRAKAAGAQSRLTEEIESHDHQSDSRPTRAGDR